MGFNDIIFTTLITVATNIATFFVTKRKKDNDFLADLQNSIDLLSSRYNAALEELCAVKKTNVELTYKVNQLITENETLRADLKRLSSCINRNTSRKLQK